jgi:hypothetical protein
VVTAAAAQSLVHATTPDKLTHLDAILYLFNKFSACLLHRWSCAISDDGQTLAATSTSGDLYVNIINHAASWQYMGQPFLSRVLLLNNGALLFGQQAEQGNGFEEYGSLLLSTRPNYSFFTDLGQATNAGSWIGMAASYDGKFRAAVQHFGYVWTR